MIERRLVKQAARDHVSQIKETQDLGTQHPGGRAVLEPLPSDEHQRFTIALGERGKRCGEPRILTPSWISGLEMLRNIDAEFVKLDRSIVATAATEPGARAVLMAMATFARQTGAFVIAEGIEGQDTLQFLRGIDEHDPCSDPIIQGGQGFGLGRPSSKLAPKAPAMLHDMHTSGPSALGV
jgi:transposase